MKVYLISGNSILLINEKINEIVKDNKNVTSFDMSINTIEDVLLEAGYFSMFAEEKYIIIRNASFFSSGKLNDKDMNALLNYLANPNDLSCLIFICEEIDSRKKITKIIKEKYQIISIPPLKPYEIENRLQKYLTSLNYQIKPETLKYIVNNSLNNYDLAMNEIEKIVLYYNKPCLIKEEDVQNIIAKNISTNNFLFVDALIDNNLEKSLDLLKDLKTMKTEPSIIIALIARDVRIMLNIKKLLEQQKREYEIMNYLKLTDWQLEKYLKKAFPYKIKELEELLIKLTDIDLKIKSGKIDKYYSLELLILDLCS